MGVEFSPERLPAELVCALWDGYGPTPGCARPVVELDGEHTCRRFVEELHGHTAGSAGHGRGAGAPAALVLRRRRTLKATVVVPIT
jgi:hypothetical protein